MSLKRMKWMNNRKEWKVSGQFLHVRLVLFRIFQGPRPLRHSYFGVAPDVPVTPKKALWADHERTAKVVRQNFLID